MSSHCSLLCLKFADDACPLIFQWVNSCSALLYFKACQWCLLFALQPVSTTVSCYILSLMTMPVLCSPVCELLLWLVVIQACWWCLSTALQSVSSCCALLCFKPANDASLLSSLWVPDLPCCIQVFFMLPALCSPACEICHALLCCLKLVDNAHLLFSSLWVAAALCEWFKPANNTCPLLYRKWVAAMPY